MHFSTADGVFDDLPQLLALPNETVLLSTAFVLFVILVLSSFVSTIIGSRRLMGLAGGILVIGSVVYIRGMTCDFAEILVLGMALGGAAIAILKVAWGECTRRWVSDARSCPYRMQSSLHQCFRCLRSMYRAAF